MAFVELHEVMANEIILPFIRKNQLDSENNTFGTADLRYKIYIGTKFIKGQGSSSAVLFSKQNQQDFFGRYLKGDRDFVFAINGHFSSYAAHFEGIQMQRDGNDIVYINLDRTANTTDVMRATWIAFVLKDDSNVNHNFISGGSY